ncbi:MAG TPA: glycoside hydrolase family 6 protein, partial [Longimicrobium sp.]|nr:glycoside hydrolase family 6 protein [Longimicrobium sp.]
QALGRAPTTRTGHPLVDAYLGVKMPGQSDGTCNGGPRAGEWWADYALELSRAAQALGSLAPR